MNAYRTRRHDTADLTDRGGMLRTGQVAAILGVGTRAVKAMCLRGDLSYVHGNGPRGHLRIFRASVERYLDRLYQPS